MKRLAAGSCAEIQGTTTSHSRGQPSDRALGPFILHDGLYANLESVEEVFNIGINRAVTLLAEKAAGGGKGRFQRNKPTVLKDLGAHPDGGGNIQVLSGRYGPYITNKEKNARIPKDRDPKTLTLAECQELLEKAPVRGRRGAKKKTKAKAKTKKKTKTKAKAKTKKKTRKKAAKKKAARKKTKTSDKSKSEENVSA